MNQISVMNCLCLKKRVWTNENEDVTKIFCNKSRKQLLESSYTEIDNDKNPRIS